MNGDWFYMIKYGVFDVEQKITERSSPGNLARWKITQSKDFTRKGIEKVNRSVRGYIYLILTSQVQARSSIVGNSAFAVDVQQVFNSTFNTEYSIGADIDKYQSVLEHSSFKASDLKSDSQLPKKFVIFASMKAF